jgi:hypothetical protein
LKNIIAVIILLGTVFSGCGQIKDKVTEKINDKIENTLDEQLRKVDSLTESSLKNIDSISKRTGMSVDSIKAQLDSMNRITKEAIKKNVNK